MQACPHAHGLQARAGFCRPQTETKPLLKPCATWLPHPMHMRACIPETLIMKPGEAGPCTGREGGGEVGAQGPLDSVLSTRRKP